MHFEEVSNVSQFTHGKKERKIKKEPSVALEKKRK